jgi:hypothetical protein
VLAEGPLRRVVAIDGVVWIEENAEALERSRSGIVGWLARALAGFGRPQPELRCHPAIADARDPPWRPVAYADRSSGWFWFAPSHATPLERVVPRIVPARRFALGGIRWGFDLAWDGGAIRIGLAPARASTDPRPPEELLQLARALHRSGFATPAVPERQYQKRPRSRAR